MKKIFTVLSIILLTSVTFAQDSTKVEITPYVAVGLSMTNSTDFSTTSYASFEAGVMIDNFSIGGVFGVNNLKSFDQGINGYWYEGKVAYAFPLGFVDGYGVFGVGTYIGSKGSLFIEYGGGISKSFSNLGTFIQVSNWDGITYLTPGLSYSF
jgi:hypothetical protein